MAKRLPTAEAHEALSKDARVGIVAVALSRFYGGPPEHSISGAVEVIAALDASDSERGEDG